MTRWRTRVRRFIRRVPPALGLGASVLLVSPAQSLAAALVRFIHAVPTAGTVTVEVSQGGATRSVGTIGFAGVTSWRTVRSGPMNWALVTGAKTLAHGRATLGSGAYDLVLLSKSAAGVRLGIFKADGGRRGSALVRVIHAAPELGSPQLWLDSKLVDPSLAFTQATPYLDVTPGEHTLSAFPPHESLPLIRAHVTLDSGAAYSFVVVGSDGQRVRVVPLVDRGGSLTRPAAPVKLTAATDAARGTVTVQPGDSLWTIARARLGDGASDEAIYREYQAIWHENAARIGTGDPSLIFPGQRLTLPAA